MNGAEWPRTKSAIISAIAWQVVLAGVAQLHPESLAQPRVTVVPDASAVRTGVVESRECAARDDPVAALFAGYVLGPDGSGETRDARQL